MHTDDNCVFCKIVAGDIPDGDTVESGPVCRCSSVGGFYIELATFLQSQSVSERIGNRYFGSSGVEQEHDFVIVDGASRYIMSIAVSL